MGLDETVPRRDADKLERAAALAALRGDIHGFLAEQLIRPPLRENETVGSLLKRWEPVAMQLDDEYAQRIVAQLRSGDPSAEVLNREFSDLLVVPTGRYLAPIESVWTGAATSGAPRAPGRLRGKPWAQVTAAYRSKGFGVPHDAPLEGDHLACELQFLSVLCTCEREAWLQSNFEGALEARKMQREFIEDHPLAWIDPLCERCREVSRTPYFPELLSLIRANLRREWEQLRGDEEQE